MPMDIEWAFITGKYTDSYSLDLKLLQARPITALFTLDTKMMTQPGERRKLYYDGNIISEATTTSPFTAMDLDFYCKLTIILCGPKSLREAKEKNWKLYSESSDMPMFNSSTRQYVNMSHIFKYMSTQSMSNVRLCCVVLCTKYATVACFCSESNRPLTHHCFCFLLLCFFYIHLIHTIDVEAIRSIFGIDI